MRWHRAKYNNHKLYRLFSNLIFNKRWISISFSPVSKLLEMQWIHLFYLFTLVSTIICHGWMRKCLIFIFPYHQFVFAAIRKNRSIRAHSCSVKSRFYIWFSIFIFVQKRRRLSIVTYLQQIIRYLHYEVHLLHHLFNYTIIYLLYRW